MALTGLRGGDMTQPTFGKPETGGVVFDGEAEQPKRRVRVTGHVSISIDVDEWIDVEPGEDNSDIKQAAIEAAGITFDGRGDFSAYLDIEDETKKEEQARMRRERDLLAAWNAGQPITAGA
jgi:hypothetical protein